MIKRTDVVTVERLGVGGPNSNLPYLALQFMKQNFPKLHVILPKT